MRELDIGAVLAADQPRDIETITGEILEAKRVGGEAILTIGRCLSEAKAVLPHGEWLLGSMKRLSFPSGRRETLCGWLGNGQIGKRLPIWERQRPCRCWLYRRMSGTSSWLKTISLAARRKTCLT